MDGTGSADASPLVLTNRGVRSWIQGLVALIVGIGLLGVAQSTGDGGDAWVVWVLGGGATILGVFTLFVRSRVVFDPSTRTWTDAWNFLVFRRADRGRFDDLTTIRVERSQRRHGFGTSYVWVLADDGTRILADSALDPEKAWRTARRLQSVLSLPIETEEG